MPKPRKLTDEQARAALAEFIEWKGKRGAVAQLARKYECSWNAMDNALQRAAIDQGISDSRGTSEAAAP